MTDYGKTLVTGGTGFVGRAVVTELLLAGRAVRVLARHPDHPALAGLAVEVARGDLRDPESLHLALTGCTRLFHVAADYRLWVPDPETMYAINVEGTGHGRSTIDSLPAPSHPTDTADFPRAGRWH